MKLLEYIESQASLINYYPKDVPLDTIKSRKEAKIGKTFQKFIDAVKFENIKPDFDKNILEFLMDQQPQNLETDRSNEQDNVKRSKNAALIRALIQVSKGRDNEAMNCLYGFRK